MTPSDSHESTHFSGSTEDGLSDADYKHDDILGGRYRVISLLGRGGMGVVYKVEQIFLGKELALKTIDRHLMSDLTVRRFKAEARAAFAVDHPNIVSVHDFGLFDDETPFLVMEIVQGETLSDRLKRGTLSIDEAISIYIQVCFGLAHAHDSGVVHRDIKPSNIMLLTDVPEGIETGVKILDFGIAKLTQSEGGEVQALTKTGEIFGSPLYMSPEQCSGAKVDHRADVYSLGCVVFESLTGTPPFVGENALMTMMMHQTASIPTLKEGSLGAEFPPEFERLVALMLAKNPDDRYQSLGDAAHELAALKRGEAPQLSAAIKPRRPAGEESQPGVVTLNRDNFAYAMVGLALATLVVSSGLTYFMQAANVQVPSPVVVAPTKPEPVTPVSTAFQPVLNEESIMFDSGIMSGANEFTSKVASDLSLRAFKNYPYAQVLSLQNGTITDTGIQFLQDSKLLKLELNNCTIDRLDGISKLPYLQEIDLSKTQIDDRAIPKLANLKMLHALNLSWCNISEDGLRKLIPSTSLSFLVLTPKKYSAAFITELYEKMPQCRILPYRKTSKLQDIEIADKKKDRAITVEKLIAVAEKSNKNAAVIGVLLTELASIRQRQGRSKEARMLVDRAAAQFERCGELRSLVPVLAAQANLAVADKDSQKAITLVNRAEQLFLDTTVHNSDDNMLPYLRAFGDVPIQLRKYAPAIEYSKTAVHFIDLYPNLDKDHKLLPMFLERLGWLYTMDSKPDLALPYLKRAVDITRVTENKDPQTYLRVVIEYAHTLGTQNEKRKELYKEAIQELEKLGLPEDLNLKEHYCDACVNMSVMLAAEHDYNGAVLYTRKGLEALRQFKHQDIADRKPYLIKSLVEQLRAAGREAEAKKEIAKYGVKM